MALFDDDEATLQSSTTTTIGPIGSDYEFYYHLLDLSNTWGYYPALLIHVTTVISSVCLAVLMFRRQHQFPFNSIPTKLYILTQISCPIGSFSYTHMMLYPFIPCWVQIFAAGGIHFVASPTVINIFHLWFLYNVQYSMSVGALDSFFYRHNYVIKGYKYLMILVVSLWVFSSPFVLVRLLTKSSDVLAGHFTVGECADFTIVQLLTKAFCTGLFSTLGFALAFAMKDVKEAFHLKRQYKKACALFFATAPVVVSPWFLRDFLPKNLFLNLLILGQLMWASAILAYTYFISFYLVRLSYYVTQFTNRNHSQGSRKEDGVSSSPLPLDGGSSDGKNGAHFSHLISKGGGGSASIDLSSWASIQAHVEKVSTVHEIRACLSGQEAKQKFKGYLVREFCVENMLFIIALEDFTTLEDPHKRLETARELCRDFVADGSPSQINISEKLRKTLLAAVQDEKDPSKIPRTLFAKAEEEVYRVLIDSFNRFLHHERVVMERAKASSSSKKNSAAGGFASFFAGGGGSSVSSLTSKKKPSNVRQIVPRQGQS